MPLSRKRLLTVLAISSLLGSFSLSLKSLAAVTNHANLDKQPPEAGLPAVRNSAIAYQLGLKQQEAGRFGDAIASFKKAMEAEPAQPTYAYALAKACQLTGDWDNAITWYQKAVGLAPMDNDYKKSLVDAVSVAKHTQVQYGPGYVVYSPWHTANFRKETVATDLAHRFYLVGLSVETLGHMIGGPTLARGTRSGLPQACWTAQTEGSSSYFFPILGPYEESMLEVEYTQDHKRVLRFRMVEKVGETTIRLGKFSEWQTTDFRTDPQQFNSPDWYYKLTRNNLDSTFWLPRLDPHKFDPIKWNEYRDGRVPMVVSLFHSYPIVGMVRSKVHDLLGLPIKPLKKLAPDDSAYEDTESYQLSFVPCADAGVEFWELLYTNDRVTGFRLALYSREPRLWLL